MRRILIAVGAFVSSWTAPPIPLAQAECVAPHRECLENLSPYNGRCRRCVFANVAPGEVDLFDQHAMGRFTASDGRDYWLVEESTYVAKRGEFEIYERARPMGPHYEGNLEGVRPLGPAREVD